MELRLLPAAVSCPPNSHYEACATACPPTCMDPTAPAACGLPCAEACLCDSGFLLYDGTCVPSGQCGCWHEGRHYPVGAEFWADDTCSSKCTCPSRGGQLSCSSASCPEGYYCGVQSGVRQCLAHTYGVCQAYGDPHYYTFDGVTHHFMGICTYTLAKVCANTTGLPSFNIEAKNEHRGNPSVSYVQRVLVEVYGQQIEILKNSPSRVLTLVLLRMHAVPPPRRLGALRDNSPAILSAGSPWREGLGPPFGGRILSVSESPASLAVNKVWATLPVVRLNGAVTVSRSGRYVALETDFRLRVSYDADHSVEIRLPVTYFNRTCGLCGNFDGRRQDDSMMPDGQQAQTSTQLGQSWQVPGAEHDEDSCGGPGATVPPPPPCLPETEALCGLLTSKQGPFEACHSAISPTGFFESCVFDVCAGSLQLLCSALESYADACQGVGVNLPRWRNSTFCPLPCPANSHYNTCTNACPATCANPLAPRNCSKPCAEGCECNTGFALSGAECVSVADCGCLQEGKYYEKGEAFWQADCQGQCRCVGNNSLLCNTETCRVGQVCKVQNGVLGCYTPDTATCHIYGDPHYVTFDGRLYHFQGSCNYTAVKVCTNSSEQFSVTTRNERRWSAAWTALNSVAISFRNLHIALRKNKEVYVNEAKVDLPVELHLGIRVEERPPYVVIHTPFGLLAKFNGDQELLVQVDERYKGHLCGLCGTYTGSQLDDFLQSDGILGHDPNRFGSSWRVPDDHWTCDPSIIPPPPCNPDDEMGFEDLCRVILATEGPFEVCHWSIPPQLYFESCVYDQCATGGDTGQFCKSLEAYAAACELRGEDLGDWRKDTVCAPTTTAVNNPAPPSSGAPSPCDLSCSFDTDLCSWRQSSSDSTDWTRHKGPTPSPTTGPSFDHTTGDGYFIYLDGSRAEEGDVAHLVSPTCSSHKPQCFRFWYHMYGVARTMSLRVYVASGSAAPELIWSASGNQGNRWWKAEVSVAHQGSVQVILEGVRGEDYRSDVAVDDISVVDGYCSEPTTTPVNTPALPSSESCLVSGDPHYYTFDKHTHHFMGNCTYTLSRLCSQNSSLPFFNVEATNEHRGGNTQVSYVQSVDVDVSGVQITLGKGGVVKVNGAEVTVPASPAPGVEVRSSGFYRVVSTDFGLRVKFDGDHQVELTLPSAYRAQVCGLCGNYNGNPADDFQNPSGGLEPDSASLGVSWQVSNSTSCSSGSEPTCTEAEKEVAQSSSFCGLITDVTGPFRHCHGAFGPAGHFASCLYDQCALHLDPGALCRSLQAYADACQALGVRVESWRNATFCPVSCPPNSHYEACATACPPTCVDPAAPAACGLPCAEACLCDSGFLLYDGTCVPSGQCGCWHEGRHYPVGAEFWADDTCSSKCTCPSRGGQLSCSSASCPEGYYCGVQSGVRQCLAHTYGVCQAYGDPHYYTFDGVTHHFMGICTYTLAKVCANATGLPSFNIEAKNEHRGNPSVSYIQRVLVEVYGQQIEILKNSPSRVLVNKVWATLPVVRLNGAVTVSRSGRYVALETDFRLRVSYDADHSVEIRLPVTYFNRTCGLCGNFDGRRQDDSMMPDGQQAQTSTQLGQSWQVPGAEHDEDSCGGPGATVPPPPPCLPETEALCGLLTSKQGPFEACHSAISPTGFFESCVFDVCASSLQLLCSALESYADACQGVGVNLPRWRNSTFCPLPCPPNAHYEPCATACPATCLQQQAPENCSQPCVEDCACDAGLVLSGRDCVAASSCGCVHAGQYYLQGESFVTEDCSQSCKCGGNGAMECVALSCSPEEVCRVQEGLRGCYPARTATCHVYGDPHYSTFDGRLHHFQGACNYTLVQACNHSSAPFSITARNEHRGSPLWTALNSVAVTLQGLHIALRKGRAVYVSLWLGWLEPAWLMGRSQVGLALLAVPGPLRPSQSMQGRRLKC
ncbi:IgGFc-binding protein-like [Tiliqua scincoides]|uniref:IgGFc-binding protein-like n=1 Tax=Tiliqua scincoides TaxID=71010 RepID=UPI003462B2A8